MNPVVDLCEMVWIVLLCAVGGSFLAWCVVNLIMVCL